MRDGGKSGVPCQKRLQIRELVSGQCADAGSAWIQEHVRHCPDCAAELEALDKGLDPFVSELRSLLDPQEIRSNEAFREALGRLKSRRLDATLTAAEPRERGPVLVSGVLGDFGIIREIGRGGMGIVYEAEQLSLSRRVALKILPFAALLDPRQLQRFQNEARAAASLEHPNIVAVYGVGVERGVHYYAMRYIDGRNLAQILAELRERAARISPASEIQTDSVDSEPTRTKESDLTDLLAAHAPAHTGYLRAVARIGVQAAEALDYAHERGIVHRDIKPGNLMIDQTGRLWVADFGLARIETDPTLSISGAILGTLRYMSPEQALGKRGVVDHRSDVYSLGITLYELLTLTPIFPDAQRATLVGRIANEEPKPPRQLNSRIPADLETIVLKAMAKNPADRYETAGALAADLKRFLEARPILARPVGRARRVLKWARRRPAVAALLAVSALAALGLLAGGWWHAATLQTALTVTERLRDQAEAHRVEADALHHAAVKQQAITQDRELLVRKYLYAADVKLAFSAWKSHHIKEAVDLFSRHLPRTGERDLRTFTWHYLWRLCNTALLTLRGHTGRIYGVAYSPDGKLLATAGTDGTARLWDAATGRELAVLNGHAQGDVNAVAFSPDGTTLATGGDDRTARIWDVDARRLRATCAGHTQDVSAVAFSPDGRMLATAGADRLIKLWNPQTGRECSTLRGHAGWIRGLAFSPDGSRLASASTDGTAKIWNPQSGGVQTTFNKHAPAYLLTVAFSHDGRSVATGDDAPRVKVWDPATGIEKAAFAANSESVRCVAFSSDDRTLMAAAHDGCISFWDLATGRLQNTFRGHTDKLWCAALSPVGRKLATSSSDQTVKVWDVETRQERSTLGEIPVPACGVAFSLDGKQLVSVGFNARTTPKKPASFRIWDLITGSECKQYRRDAQGEWPVLAANARSVATQTDDRPRKSERRVLDYAVADQWRPLRFEFPFTEHPINFALSPDGRSIAAGDLQGNVGLWDLAGGGLLAKLQPSLTSTVFLLEFSPDGRLLAAANDLGGIAVWDVPTRTQRARLDGHAAFVYGLCFAPDGKTLASASADRTIKLWNLATSAEVATLAGHTGEVRSVTFSSDLKTLASGSDDGTVRLWDLRTLQELGSLDAQQGGVCSVAFAPDGSLLASGGATRDEAGEILLWSAAAERR